MTFLFLLLKNCSFFHTEAPHFILFDGGSIFFYYNSWLDNDPPSNRCKLLGRSFVLIAPNQAQAKRQKCEGKMCFLSVFCTHTEEKKCTNHFKHNMAVRSAFSLPFLHYSIHNSLLRLSNCVIQCNLIR